ncbi:hypothetical protein CERZMDRAFT_69565 [Cercospora zeae-maydis SCOH1-5]|uniref:Uncharacterized protein n=1 Tax=Cercospora zeae-maydis SCOH1-5 TaxID=717836 RepID=A0A6A6FA50_9PEZI|nr:hypothetical protein CERZMDRAFT_69565 [Cercospora zeae-maydis SCOH1-5]
MPPPLALLKSSIDSIHQETFSGSLNRFVENRNSVWEFIGEHWFRFLAWLAQPHIYAVIIAWAITFTAVTFLLLSLGFGPVGVAAGSVAAAFQGCAYGAFTPAGGIFATLTSFAMLGLLMPAVVLIASLLATTVATIVWMCGVGR